MAFIIKTKSTPITSTYCQIIKYFNFSNSKIFIYIYNKFSTVWTGLIILYLKSNWLYYQVIRINRSWRARLIRKTINPIFYWVLMHIILYKTIKQSFYLFFLFKLFLWIILYFYYIREQFHDLNEGEGEGDGQWGI
jgi:hypothetical protein